MDRPVDILKGLASNFEVVIAESEKMKTIRRKRNKKGTKRKKTTPESNTSERPKDTYVDDFIKRKITEFDKLPIFEQLRRRRLG